MVVVCSVAHIDVSFGTVNLMFVLDILASVKVCLWPPFGKHLLPQLTICSLCEIMSIYCFSYCPFWFRGQGFGSNCTSSLSLLTFGFRKKKQNYLCLLTFPLSLKGKNDSYDTACTFLVAFDAKVDILLFLICYGRRKALTVTFYRPTKTYDRKGSYVPSHMIHIAVKITIFR